MTPPSDSVDLDSLLPEREWVSRVARALARDESAADDAAQDAWLAAMRAPPRSPGAVRAWFRRVLRRRTAEVARGADRRRRREEIVSRPEAQPSAAEIVAKAEAHRAVVEAVFELAEPWRTTVVLRHFEGLESSEIAAKLGVPADTVRARLRRAHEDLRRRLEPKDRGPAAWLLLLPARAPNPVPGGLLVASSTTKAALPAAGLLLLLAGAAFWTWGRNDAAQRAAGDAAAAPQAAEAVAAVKPVKTGKRDASDAATTSAPDPTKARLLGDVRFVAGDRPAAGVAVELRGALPPRSATTDDSGAYRFDDVPPGGPFTVVAAHAPLAAAKASGLRLAAGDARRVDTLWLDEPVRVDVRVVAADGAPIEGASVEAFRGHARIEREDWSAAAPASQETVTTDAAGRARLPGLAVGSWTFRAAHPRFAPGGVGPKDVLRGGVALDVVIRLEPGHSLEGTITGNDGKPLADALVLALPPVEAQLLMDPAPVDPLRTETRTDAEGRYRFAALSTGEHHLALELPGTLPARIGVVSIPSVSRFDVRLDGARLGGRVTEEGTGRPLEGARVRAAVWRSHSPTYMTAVTDADGRWSVAAPLGGILNGPARGDGEAAQKPVHFDVEKEGYVYAPEVGTTPWRAVWVFGGRDAEYDSVMRPAASLAGVVTGPDGPVAGAEITADVWSPVRGSLPSRATTDETGRYRFGGLAQGKARLVVTRAGYFQAASPGGPWRAGPAPDAAAVVEIPARGEATLDVRLERGASLRGKVVDDAGAVVAAAEIACDEPGAAPRRMTSDAAGAFEIAGLRPGAEASIRASKDGYADAEAKAAARVGEDDAAAPTTLVMRRAGVVRGRVVAPGGGAPDGAWVQIAPAKTALDEGYEVVGVWQHAPRHPVLPDGSFEAPIGWGGGASEGGVVARAGAPGFAPAISDRLVAKDRVADAGELRLEAGLRLEGRVVAADGSGPIAGAQIEIENEKLPPALAQRRDWRNVGRENTPFEVVARTDADGRFVVEGLPPWRYELRVMADDHGWAEPTVALPQEAPLNVELPPLGNISGRVVFDDDSPAAHVAVLAHGPGDTQDVAGFTETSNDGTFEVQFLAPGRYVLESRRPSDRVMDVLPTTTTPVEGGARDVKIVLKRGGGRISGKCVAGGGVPVAGALVSLKAVAGGMQLYARSGADGRFDASGLPDGAWTISAQSDRSVGGPEAFGKRIVADAVEAAVGARDVTLEFRAAAPIVGRVVRDDGTVPAGELMVRARRGDDARWTQAAPVGAGGAFTLAGTSAGTWTLSVLDRNTGVELKTSGATQFAAGVKDARLVVASSTALSGRVADERGRAVVGARVVARAGADAVETVSDVEGRFTWTGLGAGPWTLEAIDPETGRAEAAGVAPGGVDVALTLRASEAVSARIVGGDDKPVRGADVTLATSAGAVVARLHTDADGRFTTRALPAGEYVVALVARDGRALDAAWPLGRVRSGAVETVLRM